MTNSHFNRIVHEILLALSMADCRGISKHEEKIKNRQRALETGEKYEQAHGMYAQSTYTQYKKCSFHFLKFINKIGANPGHLRECRRYIKLYVEDMEARHLSAWTIRTRIAALQTIFRCRVSDFNVKLPPRNRADIKRARSVTKTDLRFHGKKYDDLIKFTAAIGARKEGLSHVTKDALIVNKHGQLMVHLHEKGGKDRYSLVLPEDRDFVEKTFRDSPGYGERNYLFPNNYIPHSLCLHYCRAIYARKLYEYFKKQGKGNGQLYRCRKELKGKVYDRQILLLVSRNLGHNRLDVVVSNYLYERKGSEL